MFCGDCGNANDDGKKFCVHCGAPLASKGAAPAADTASKSGCGPVIGFLAVVGVVSFFICLFLDAAVGLNPGAVMMVIFLVSIVSGVGAYCISAAGNPKK